MEEQIVLFRDSGITTEFRKFVGVLNEFGSQDRLQKAALARRANLSQGEAYRIFRDAKTLGLVRNGDGLTITPLGRQWVREALALSTGLPSIATLQQAALNVPLFSQARRDIPEVKDPDGIMAYFCRHVGADARTKDVSCARRRYLEAFVQRGLPRSLPARTEATIREPGATSAREQRLQLATAYSNLIQTYGEEAIDECHAFFFARKK
jgi:hypothetical protein